MGVRGAALIPAWHVRRLLLDQALHVIKFAPAAANREASTRPVVSHSPPFCFWIAALRFSSPTSGQTFSMNASA